MRVIVLCTGRCGSMTFYKACTHISNYTAGHETRHTYIGHHRADFPDNHIEVDPRLIWFHGRLEQMHRDAFYVHLRRNPLEVHRSYLRKFLTKNHGTARAFYELCGRPSAEYTGEMIANMVNEITVNIAFFLRDKKCMAFDIEKASKRFPLFWERIGAKGDINAALAEFDKRYNVGSNA